MPNISTDLNIILTKTDKKVLDFLERYHSLTLQQISDMFFGGQYKYASKRMLLLEQQEFKDRTNINSAFHRKTKEKVYYTDYILSEHDSKVFDIYAKIHSLDGYVSKFEWKPRYLNDLIEADAYIEFEYMGNLYFYIIEIDYNHFTSPKKFKLYEKFYNEKQTDIVPYFIVIRKTNNDIKYDSKYFDIYYLDHNLSKFEDFVLGVL